MFLKHSKQNVVKFNFGLGTNPNAVRHEIPALCVHYFTFDRPVYEGFIQTNWIGRM